jgi:hypothetical protein
MTRLHLNNITKSLASVQKEFNVLNKKLHMRRDPMDDVIVENMLSGYRYIDRLLRDNIDITKKKAISHILELNHIVLCGTDQKVREEFRKHIKDTTDRFYGQNGCNIGDLISWHKDNIKKSAWKRAAGLYILNLSQPQLFFEGNHRTGALLMSAVLALEDKPPFVLNLDNAEAYFNPSTLVKFTQKNIVTNLWKLPKLRKYFTEFLKNQGNRKYLI